MTAIWMAWVALASAQVDMGGYEFDPTPTAQYELPPLGTSHVVADVNGDQIGDLAWWNSQGIQVALGQLSAVPAPEVAVPLDGEVPIGGIVVADVDADGFQDLILRVERLAVVAWTGGAAGPTGPTWDLPDLDRRMQGLGDVNGDGALDFAIDTQVWHSDLAGPVAGPLLPDGVGYNILFDAGDVDADGFDDVFLSDSVVGPGYYDQRDGVLRLYPGSPTGPQPAPTWSFDRPGAPELMTRADLDGDGVDELVVAFLTLYDESAQGELLALDDLANPAGPTVLTSTRLDFDIGQGFILANLGDRDDDGADEVVASILGEVRELPWSDTTGFELDAVGADTWRRSDDAGFPTSLHTGDIDGDGAADLSVTWYAGTGYDVVVWLAAEPLPPTGTTPTGPTTSTTPTPTAPTDPGTTTDGTETGKESGDASGGCGCSQGPGIPASLGLGLVALLSVRRRR